MVPVESARLDRLGATIRPLALHLLLLVAPGLLYAAACQHRALEAPPTAVAGPAPERAVAQAPQPASTVPFGGRLPVQDPFPQATTTIADGRALLWSAWPMEGRDPQRSGRASVVGVAEPRLAWSVPIDSPSFAQVAFAADGAAYVASSTGTLRRISPDGTLGWSIQTIGPLAGPALGPGGVVYLRNGEGSLLALHPDGRRRWTTDIGAQPARLGPSPTVGPDNFSYLASYHSTLVYVVQPGGFFQWASNVQTRPSGAIAVGVEGALYFGTLDGRVRALERDQGERWSVDLGVPVASAPTIGPDGTLYVLLGDRGGLAAVSRDGRKLWVTSPCWTEGAPVLWPAVALDGRVQVGNCAVGPDGRQRWSTPTEGLWATPSALDVDGNAYFGAGPELISVSADGTLRWRYRVDGKVGPPSLGAFGAVAFTTREPDRVHLLTRLGPAPSVIRSPPPPVLPSPAPP